MASELEFRIDGWTPATIPQARLGEYLVEVAKLYGEATSVHFDGLRKGSCVLRSRVEGPAIPKVERRLMEVRSGLAPRDAIDAFRRLDDMLSSDNSSGTLRSRTGEAEIVIPFPGARRPRSPEFIGVREEGSLEGELIRIGGRDRSVHVTLQSGNATHSGIETDRDMARRLAPFIFGPTIRLNGTGTWTRSTEGLWVLARFVVSSFDEIGEASLADALDGIRAIGGSRWHLDEDPTAALHAMRTDEGTAG